MLESDSHGEPGYPPIGDYALIGDCRSAALVSKRGSIDWLCLPRFDSPSLFGAILDRHKGGRFAVRPRGRFATTRRYVPDTNVLETTFTADRGRVRLLDLFPVASEEEKARELWPEHQVLRAVECLEGEVEVEVVCDPRPEYGTVVPRLTDRGPLGFWYEHDAEALCLRSEIPLAEREDRPGVHGTETLRAGERRYVSITFTDEEPAVLPTFGEAAERRIESSLEWWSRWAATCRYDGPHRDHVVRSALALKLLTFAPSGAVVAAPTSSLPEAIGGPRNWDYRYCWLRDASVTLQAFLDLGLHEEADAFLSWIVHSTRLTRPRLQILYDVHGETRIDERVLDHLEGYRGSRPVRVGNAAKDQLQLDVYGEVIDAAAQYVRRGFHLNPATATAIASLGKTVVRCWREPDEGIWEVRSGRRHHTYSKVMCWVALDRLLDLDEAGQLEVPRERYESECRAIREEVERHGFNRELGSYTSVFDDDQVDASLLLLARYGYADAAAERMRGTTRRIEERLRAAGLLYRYRSLDDGLEGGEGAFGIASFWHVDCLCRQGRRDEAEAIFDRLCERANDVGLYGEEIDPDTGECLGNFPQAFTHAGLIDAAMTLAADRGQGPSAREHSGVGPGSGTGGGGETA